MHTAARITNAATGKTVFMVPPCLDRAVQQQGVPEAASPFLELPDENCRYRRYPLRVVGFRAPQPGTVCPPRTTITPVQLFNKQMRASSSNRYVRVPRFVRTVTLTAEPKARGSTSRNRWTLVSFLSTVISTSHEHGHAKTRTGAFGLRGTRVGGHVPPDPPVLFGANPRLSSPRILRGWEG